MIGTILNAAAIVAGGVAGLTTTRQLSPVNQTALKILLGVFTTYVGLSMVWQGLNGTFFQVLKQLGIVLLALTLGNLTGKLLRFQKSLNRLGRFAREKLSEARPDSPHRINDGFVVCSVLFCVAPMATLGALYDGLNGNFLVLAAKAVMDGLATLAFVTTFGWGAMMSALPVVAYQGTITLFGQMLRPYLETHGLLDSVNVTGGFLVFCIALIILELKKIELADYLPSLAYAALLAYWTGVWR